MITQKNLAKHQHENRKKDEWNVDIVCGFKETYSIPAVWYGLQMKLLPIPQGGTGLYFFVNRKDITDTYGYSSQQPEVV